MFKLVVLCSVLAVGAAKPGYVVPLTYSTVPAVSSLSQYSTSVVHGSSLITPTLYSTPYVASAIVPAVTTHSQVHNSPAVVLDAINGVPLDTPEVVAVRAVHYQAKALSGVHRRRKRSLAPLSYSSVAAPVTHTVVSPLSYSTPYISTYSAPALVSSPLTYSAVLPKAFGVHPG